MAEFSRRRSCVIELFPDITQPPATAIDPSYEPVGLSEIKTMSGESIIFGTLERIWGKKPKASVRFPDESAMSCTLSRDLAKSLGSKLYERVGLSGHATWNVENLSLESFHIQNLTSYKNGSIKEAFRELAEVTGDSWADIDDVKGYIRSLREE